MVTNGPNPKKKKRDLTIPKTKNRLSDNKKIRDIAMKSKIGDKRKKDLILIPL